MLGIESYLYENGSIRSGVSSCFLTPYVSPKGALYFTAFCNFTYYIYYTYRRYYMLPSFTCIVSENITYVVLLLYFLLKSD